MQSFGTNFMSQIQKTFNRGQTLYGHPLRSLYDVSDSPPCTGCLFTSKGSPVPLKSQIVRVDVVDHIANFTIDQTYLNAENVPIEAHFKFPTPAEASVYSFEARSGDKTIVCKIKEKNQAKIEYNEAIQQGNTAYYMQRDNGDMFTIAVGNLASQSSVKITIKYVVELRNEEDHCKLRLNFPLTVMPRYSSPVDNHSNDNHSNNTVEPKRSRMRPFAFSIHGMIKMHDGIVSIDSKTHRIKLSDMTETSVGFDITDIESLDTDIVVTIERKPSKTHAFLQEYPGTSDPRYRFCTALNIVPDFSRMQPVNVNNVHYVLLLDKSGSMCSSYGSNNGLSDIEICKTAAKHFVAMLPTESTFDVYTFNDRFDKFQGEFTDTNAKKVKAAEWIDTIWAQGGTELLPAMTDIYKSLSTMEKQGVVIVLSDGGVANIENVLKLVRQNPNVSLFSIGIGSSVSQELIQGLATQGNGYAEFIGSGDKNIIQKVRSQLKRSQDTLRKCQNNYEIEIKTIDGCSNFTMVPEKLAPLYDRTNNMVYVFSEQPLASIRYIERYSDNIAVTDIVPIQVIDPDVMFHRIAGVKLLNHLQHEKPCQTGSLIPGIASEVDVNKDEITRISINLNVLSRYTAFVGVEHGENKIAGGMELREVPLQLPAKYMDRMDCRALPSAMFGGFRSMQNNISRRCVSTSSMGFGRYPEPEPEEECCDSSVDLFADNDSNESDGIDPPGMDLGTSGYCKQLGPWGESGVRTIESVLLKKQTPKFSVTVSLTGMIIALSGGLLTGIMNGSLVALLLRLTGLTALPDTLSVGDVIELCDLSKEDTQTSTNGLYEIISLGSNDEPWTLQKC